MSIADIACMDFKSRAPSPLLSPASSSASAFQDFSITPAPRSTITTFPPFEDYWCSSIANVTKAQEWVSYQYNGSGPELYGLATNAKSFCRSLEAEEYSKWASNLSSYPAYSTFSRFFSHIVPVTWTPRLTPPCCNTYCNFIIPSAQLQYWPTPAPMAMKNRTTAVGPDGIT